MTAEPHGSAPAAPEPKHVSQLLHEENARLRRAVEELSILNDLARTISASLNPQEVMEVIVRRSLRAVGGEQGVITLVDREAEDPMRTIVRAMYSSGSREQFHLNQALLGWMQLNKRPLLLNDPRGDERFRGMTWEEHVHSILCVPMMIKSAVRGVLTVYNKKERQPFTEEDQRLLAIIAAQSAQVLENARLNDYEKQLLKMQEELKLAYRIQMELLPSEAPHVPGYSIVGRSIPALVVGGDYYDFIPIDGRRIAICLGDVSGKGLPASLLMANTQATLRGQTPLTPTARECVRRSNGLLYHSTSAETFVTMFYAILDPEQHRIWCSNAGHVSPFLLPGDGPTLRLTAGGPPLGMLEDFLFEEESAVLEPGGILVVCSDGMSEAMNAREELFGEARLEAVIRKHRGAGPDAMMEALFTAITAHTGGTPQSDDMTLVIVKREAGNRGV